MRKRVRRESGRTYSKFYNPEEGEYNVQYYNDWNDHRDGMRNAFVDMTKKQPKNIKQEHWVAVPYANFNEKIKKLLIRRKIKKGKNALKKAGCKISL